MQQLVAEQKETLKQLLGSHRQDVQALTSAIKGQEGGSKSKLPQLEIPTFSGEYMEWQSFYDKFVSTVHSNKDLSNVDKFTYLSGALSGVAASALKHLPANHEKALTILQKRFNKPRNTVAEFMKIFYGQPKLSQTDSKRLRAMFNAFEEVTHGLEVMQQLTHDPFMIHSAQKVVDPETRTLWFNEISESPCVTWLQFREFLEKRCDALKMETSSGTADKPTKIPPAPKQAPAKTRSSLVATAKDGEGSAACVFCKQSHRVFECPKFLSAKPTLRRNMVHNHKLCWNCLRSQHFLKECTAGGCQSEVSTDDSKTYPCSTSDTSDPSSKNCYTTPSGTNRFIPSSTSGSQPGTSQSKFTVGLTSMHAIQSQQVLLPTIQILVFDVWGRQHKCRALVDSCSQPNCITRNFAQKLALPMKRSEQSINGLGLSELGSSQAVTITINSQYEPFSMRLDCVVLECITDNQPSAFVDSGTLRIPPNLRLADPDFNKPGKIDLLLGADAFMKALRSHYISGSPSFLETVFGFIVAGECPGMPQTTLQSHLATCLCATQPQDSLQSQLEKFWLIEEVNGGQNILSPEEKKCEEHFQLHTTRNNNGRFTVSLPTRDNLQQLGESREIAEKRFKCVERRLQRDRNLYIQYREFMKQYELLEHMRLLPPDYTSPQPAVYLCHHPVIKESNSTPVRVVFDASARTKSGQSLNSVLMVGGKTQDDIFDILLRYRQHNIVLRADVQKMYRQIETVTYGTACAPFVATRCLKQLAIEEQKSFPLAAKATERDFYVDDVLTGASTVEEAKQLQTQLDQMMSQVLKQIPEDDQEYSSTLNLDLEGNVKTLGLYWNPTTDAFRFTGSEVSSAVTKRSILSDMARIYDPLGFLSPIVITAKILFQSLWKVKADWDARLNEEVIHKWQEYQMNINQVVSQVTVVRQVTCSQPQDIQLLLFCDASEKAYAASFYVRTIDSDNAVHTHLLCSKTKVAPLKQVSLPRLELCAAQLGARLLKKVMNALTIPINEIHAFSDSMIVLHWIHGEPQRWKTFVGNRVAHIQGIVPPEHWHHVKSEDNPADMASRGVSAEALISDSMWWHGPHWIQDTDMQFHDPEFVPTDNTIPEQRSSVSLVIVNEQFWSFIDHFSSFTKLVRCIAVWRRYFTILKQRLAKQEVAQGQLTVLELKSAKILLLQIVQQRAFTTDYQRLSSGTPIKRKSPIHRLQPFMDDDRLIRVGGRLSKADIGYNQKHPVLLPQHHYVTEIISSELRQEYWPVRGIEVAKKSIRDCVTCFRAKPQPVQQMMSDLHESRVTEMYPFYQTGVDFCGPVFIKTPIRSKTRLKMYIALYICLATRAVHIELVTDLTTGAFIASLRRFISRRGRPAQILCDNATNFVGASRELKELELLLASKDHQSKTQSYAVNQGIEFKFIPPRSPHFGGSWESAIKRIKYHLTRTVGNGFFTEEEMMTTLTQIEACINSRPLTPSSTDPTDLEALTPAHFLIGCPLTAAPDQSLTGIPENSLKNWALVQQRVQSFWNRWRTEFLHTMQQRNKWTMEHPSVTIGNMVLIKEDNLPPTKWMLGRVLEVHPGTDGKVRVATVQTSTGVYNRAVAKCATCNDGITYRNKPGIPCDSCHRWYHASHTDPPIIANPGIMSRAEVCQLVDPFLNGTVKWTCAFCSAQEADDAAHTSVTSHVNRSHGSRNSSTLFQRNNAAGGSLEDALDVRLVRLEGICETLIRENSHLRLLLDECLGLRTNVRALEFRLDSMSSWAFTPRPSSFGVLPKPVNRLESTFLGERGPSSVRLSRNEVPQSLSKKVSGRPRDDLRIDEEESLSPLLRQIRDSSAAVLSATGSPPQSGPLPSALDFRGSTVPGESDDVSRPWNLDVFAPPVPPKPTPKVVSPKPALDAVKDTQPSRSRRDHPVVIGRMKRDNPLPAVNMPPLRWLFVSRLARDVPAAMLRDFLSSRLTSKRKPVCINLVRRDANRRVGSFKVGLRPDEFEEALSDDFWDEGILVKEFVDLFRGRLEPTSAPNPAVAPKPDTVSEPITAAKSAGALGQDRVRAPEASSSLNGLSST
ncbi:uncharacterized protein LOC129808575 [Phlebotomus papatasi]|uniref:uncharacterized protein LOC129808575 n=1 Tax=Phlebotomus papatasi TaxID=29031 RepID=UPI002483DE85|nr:uncharacterized protein LOC129808575 [Phlebotomus papatasi]